MTGVEEILKAPHEQYAKGNVARNNISTQRREKAAKYERVARESKAAREPYRDLYRQPKIIQPKMDNWTWIKNPDLHYRMNRKKYDSYFKKGLGVVTENLFGLLGKPVGKVARNLSDAAFDMATDYDTGRSFNSDHLMNAALKTGKSLILEPIKRSVRKTVGSIREYEYPEKEFDFRHPNNTPTGGPRNIAFSPPYKYMNVDTPQRVPDLVRALDYTIAGGRSPAKKPSLGLIDYDAYRATTFSPAKPRKTWRDYLLNDGPAKRTRGTTSLIEMLRGTTVNDLINTNVASSTAPSYPLGVGVGLDSDDEHWSF